jgi:hypothetical protein
MHFFMCPENFIGLKTISRIAKLTNPKYLFRYFIPADSNKYETAFGYFSDQPYNTCQYHGASPVFP